MGHPNPMEDSWFLSSLLKGARRFLGDPVNPKKPVTPQLLLYIRSRLDLNDPRDRAFWAAALIMFFALLRKSNVFPPSAKGFDARRHLCRKDLTLDRNPSAPGILVTSRWSKTIQFFERRLQTPLPFLPGHPLCPTTAVSACLAALPNQPPDSPAIAFASATGPAPLLYNAFLTRLRQVLRPLPEGAKDYAAHSFRRGGASWALQQGIPGEVIRVMGDWQSLAYLSYLTVPLTLRRQAMDSFSDQLPSTLELWSI